MAREIEYYFTLASPWAYLGHQAFAAIAGRHGATIRYRPMPVRRVFDETGGLPLPKRHPVRQAYRLVDLQRWRARRDVPLNLTPRFTGSDVTTADRCVVALVAAGLDPDAFVRRAGAALWAHELDLGDADVLASLLADAGVPDHARILVAAQSGEVAARHERNYADALTAGIFGAPSYVLDGEVFWGQDRLDLLDEALASGREPYRPG